MKKKTIWAALLCAAVGFTGMLAGCSGNQQDTLDFEGVSELNLSMTMTASYVEVITNADDVDRVTDVLTAAEYTQTTEPTQDIDDAFRVQAYFEDGSMMDIFVRPNGSAIVLDGEDKYSAAVGAVQYDGLVDLYEEFLIVEGE